MCHSKWHGKKYMYAHTHMHTFYLQSDGKKNWSHFLSLKKEICCFYYDRCELLFLKAGERRVGKKTKFRFTWVTGQESARNAELPAFQGKDWHSHAWVFRSAQPMARWWQLGEKKGCQHGEHSGCIQMFYVGWDRGKPCLNKDRNLVKNYLEASHSP